MSYSHDEVEVRAARYAAMHDLVLEEQLGYGVHGVVWSASRRSATGLGKLSAVKVHAPNRPYYARERDIYLRLREFDVTKVCGFRVPRLVEFDDELWVIEMAIVQPPFVIDFAGAYLDEIPDFSEEVLADWRAAKQEQFEERWPEVETVLAALWEFGIHMSDVTPNNIRFANDG